MQAGVFVDSSVSVVSDPSALGALTGASHSAAASLWAFHPWRDEYLELHARPLS